jgi:poly(A) polymerase
MIPRAEHNISRANISNATLKVLYTLKDAGFDAYMVGGGVRDLLLGIKPKDFDVATEATPEEVKALFKRARIIGRRFRLVHVRFGPEVVEVSTFRASAGRALQASRHAAVADESGRMLRDNVYGSMEEDAWRRDFSVNGLYYGVRDFAIVDYVGGMADIRAGVLRVLGDADTRYREDPVRMLRAVRLSAKLGFEIDPVSRDLIPGLAHLLEDVPPARLFDEILKLLLNPWAVEVFDGLQAYGLLRYLFPETAALYEQAEDETARALIDLALRNTASRIGQDKPVTPAFLFAVFLWEPARKRARILQDQEDMPPVPALQRAGAEIAAHQATRVSIPRRFTTPMREIWQLQQRFTKRRGQRAVGLLEHRRFRAAYDFLLLRAQAGEVDPELAQWWTDFQEASPNQRVKMTRLGGGKRRSRRTTRKAENG